ncbi:MAG: efflux RND transporter periplasmic adaptor subunit [Pedobacter sp.]|nr:efflux RND transporter periplasmic adaptor subunit [Chitinophagaceae bacterium]
MYTQINKNTIKLFYSLFLVAAFSVIQSCSTKQEQILTEKQPYNIPDSLLKTLTIDSVQRGELINSITLTGQVDFNQDKQVNIYSLVSGNVQDVKVQLGDYVKQGETLAMVKSGEMAGYGNNLIIAQTNITSTKKQLDANKALYKSGIASILDVTSAQTNYDQALAQLDMIKKVLKINGNNADGNYIVKAPISGFIVQKFANNNMTIRTDNSNPLFTISDLNNVWVWANVYESNLNKVHLGDSVGITTLSYPDQVFGGKIDKILHVLDPASKVTKVRIVINNKDYALRPQMFASVTVTNTQHDQAMYVPLNALVFDNSQYYVLVYHGHNKASITPVQKLSALGNKIYIKDGVQIGDKVIASNTLEIYDQLNN